MKTSLKPLAKTQVINLYMENFKSIEDWRQHWTPEKQKLYEDTKKRKYGNDADNPAVLINDRELSEITGRVIYLLV